MNEAEEITLAAEFIRKGIHLFALVIPIGYALVAFQTAVFGVALAAVVAILIDISRFRQWKIWKYLSIILTPIIRDHEVKGGFTGASYILTTAALCIIFFPKPIAIAALVFIIIGDTAAALIGRRFGKHKLYKKKSIEGSLACLISLVAVSFVIPGLPTAVGLIGALTATLAEAFCGKLDDNLFVPISSGLVMLGIMNLMNYPGAIFFAAF
ncbi:MAG: diacylglycerol/polyprenol kinase family protein [candidate division Zixibacteria bacterium]